MKKLVFASLIFCSLLTFNGLSQEITSWIVLPERQVIFRGVDNYLEIFQSNDSLELKCTNCELTKASIKGLYLVRSDTSEYCEFYLKQIASLDLQTQKIRIPVHYLPQPTLYFDSAMNGTKCSKYASLLTARIQPGLNLDISFNVLNWKLFIDDKVFTGDGNRLSDEAKSYLSKSSSHTTPVVTIFATVIGPDEIKRIIAGAYSL